MVKGSPEIRFDVWGCRGSRSLTPGASRVGVHTSCYSLLAGEHLFVFDAGRGLARLGERLWTEASFERVKEVHVLITHAHMDHWEGLKDVSWFWRQNNGLVINLYCPRQARDVIARSFAYPSYVPLELLGSSTVADLVWNVVEPDQEIEIGGWRLSTVALHHYSGMSSAPDYLDTIGYLVSRPDGPAVAYLSDHEPTEATTETEDDMASRSNLMVLDSHFLRISDHAFGHGSQEQSSRLADRHQDVLVLAGHLSPNLSDEDIEAQHAKLSRGLPNFQLAREGMASSWDGSKFVVGTI